MLAAWLVAGTVLFLIGLFYYSADPSSGLMPRCTFKVITGYDCPGCGFQRALHALLHGHVAEAWHYNAFAFFAVPAALWFIVVEALRKRFPRLHAASVHPMILAATGVAIVAWWVGRNIF